MSYYQCLGLVREPFSNSPDPELLYAAKNHLECLRHMEIAVRLRRGLNVVLGDVGTGKTTLARELIRILGQDPTLAVYLLDDPHFPGPGQFLLALARLFGLDVAGLEGDPGRLREALKDALLRQGVDGGKTVTLIIDEGQKLSGQCLELLRELLNFETNTHKLLQIVIFAQKEFEHVLASRPNLEDRVNFRYRLTPLDRCQTSRMIAARLARCAPDGQAPALLTPLALRRIHGLTRGYPRKIVRLCHSSMLLAVGLGRRRIGWRLVGRAARELQGQAAVWPRRISLAAGLGGLALAVAMVGSDWLFGLRQDFNAVPPVPAVQQVDPVPPTANAPEPVSPPIVAVQAASERLATDTPAPAAAPEPAQTLQEAAWAAAATFPAPGKPANAGPVADASAVPAVPAALGSSPVLPGWSVSRQAARLYGCGDLRILALVAKANPHVNLDRLRAGEGIVFPAIEAAPLPPGSCLIAVGQAQSLEAGFAFLAASRAGWPGLGLFTTFQPGSGLHFEVMVEKVFADRPAAAAALAALPPELAGGARLVEHYPQGTIYFTDLRDRSGKRPLARLAGTDAPGPRLASAQKP